MSPRPGISYAKFSFSNLLIALIPAFALVPANQSNAGSMVPRPQVTTQQTTRYGLPGTFEVKINAGLGLSLIDSLLTTYLSQGGASGCFTAGSGMQLILHQFGTSPPSGVTLPESLVTFPRIGTEGYVLVVDKPSSVVRLSVGAAQKAGLWRGAATMLQLLLHDPDTAGGQPGCREDSVTAQIIKDYPDHAMRGAHWLTLSLTKKANGKYCDNDSTNCLSAAMRQNLDALVRYKVNTLFWQPGTTVFNPQDWTTLLGRHAVRAVSAYARDRYIDVVPEAIVPAPGDFLEYSDAPWHKDRPFVFAIVEDSGIQFNGSFERDWTGNGLADGWNAFNQTYHTRMWNRDSVTFYDGDASMRLDQTITPPNDTLPTLSGFIAVPRSIIEMHPDSTKYYGLSVRLRWQDRTVSTDTIIVAAVAQDSLRASLTTAPRRIRVPFSASSNGWILKRPSDMTPGRLALTNRARFVHVYVQHKGGTGKVWVDRFQLIPTTPSGVPLAVTPIQEAIPAEKELVRNGGMEYGSGPWPTSWWKRIVGGAPCDSFPVTLPTAGTWERDSSEKHSGKWSMKLALTDSTSTSNQILLAQTVNGSFPAGTYRLTAWGKARWTNIGDNFPQINFYFENGCGADIIGSGDLYDRNSLSTQDSTTGWCFYQATLRLPTSRTRMVVFSRILPSSYGTIWLDDVSVVRLPNLEPMKNLLRNGDLNSEVITTYQQGCNADNATCGVDSCGTCPGGLPMPQHWNRMCWGCFSNSSEPPYKAQWTMVSGASARTGNSLKLVAPTGTGNTSSIAIGQDIVVPGVHKDSLPGGWYQVSAWARTEGLGGDALPQVTLGVIGGGETRIASFTVGGSTTLWTRLVGHVFAPAAFNNLSLYSRIADDGTGTLFLDDLAVRRVDGALENAITTVYKPVVKWPNGSAYSTSLFETRAARVEMSLNPSYVPARIFRKQTAWASDSLEVTISYDQWIQLENFLPGANTSCPGSGSACTSPGVDLYRPSVVRLVTDGFASGATPAVVAGPTEFRGVNRSGLGRLASGTPNNSNAKTMARWTNTLADAAQAITAGVKLFNWHDMWSYMHLGGDASYNVKYGNATFGGPAGRIGDALRSTDNDSTLEHSIQLMEWWYGSSDFAPRVRSAQVATSLNYSHVQATWLDTLAITQAAALTQSMRVSAGGVGTSWDQDDTGAKANFIAANERFWNTPWRQIYFDDLNTRFSRTTVAGVSVSVKSALGSIASTAPNDSLYAAPPLYPPGRNRGGILVHSAPASSDSFAVLLPTVPVDSLANYRIVVSARDAAALQVRPVWRDGGTSHEGVRQSASANGTYPLLSLALGSGSTWGAESLRVYLKVTPATGKSAAIDNLAIWEAAQPCIKSLAKASAPSSVNKETPPGTYTVGALVTNIGCRPIWVVGSSTVPPNKLLSSSVVFIPAGQSRTIYGQGTIAESDAEIFQWKIRYRDADGAEQTVQITVSVVAV